MSKKDTLAWRAQGRGRGVLGPEEMGEAVQTFAFFRPADGAVTALSARKRPVSSSFLARSSVEGKTRLILF